MTIRLIRHGEMLEPERLAQHIALRAALAQRLEPSRDLGARRTESLPARRIGRNDAGEEGIKVGIALDAVVFVLPDEAQAALAQGPRDRALSRVADRRLVLDRHQGREEAALRQRLDDDDIAALADHARRLGQGCGHRGLRHVMQAVEKDRGLKRPAAERQRLGRGGADVGRGRREARLFKRGRVGIDARDLGPARRQRPQEMAGAAADIEDAPALQRRQGRRDLGQRIAAGGADAAP